MDSIIIYLIVAVVALGAGFAAGYFYYRYVSEKTIKSAEVRAEEIVAVAEAKTKEMAVQAKEEAIRFRTQVEQEVARKRQEVERHEERLQKRNESLDKRLENLERKERNLNKRQSQVDKKANDIEKLHEQRVEELERISAMTVDEAKGELLQVVELEARQDMARVIRQVEAGGSLAGRVAISAPLKTPPGLM
jgi:ribonucrease Y